MMTQHPKFNDEIFCHRCVADFGEANILKESEATLLTTGEVVCAKHYDPEDDTPAI